MITQTTHKLPYTTRRQKLTALGLVGILSGIVASIVKFGWEVPFPPRTPERNMTNPPQEFLQQLGFPYEFTHEMYTFSENQIPLFSIMVHFGFSIFFGILYAIVAELWPKIKLWQGAAYGLALWFGAHVVVLPLLGTVPSPFPWLPGAQSWAEHLSEISGHAFTFWVMELVRRDLKERLTGYTDMDQSLRLNRAR